MCRQGVLSPHAQRRRARSSSASSSSSNNSSTQLLGSREQQQQQLGGPAKSSQRGSGGGRDSSSMSSRASSSRSGNSRASTQSSTRSDNRSSRHRQFREPSTLELVSALTQLMRRADEGVHEEANAIDTHRHTPPTRTPVPPTTNLLDALQRSSLQQTRGGHGTADLEATPHSAQGAHQESEWGLGRAGGGSNGSSMGSSPRQATSYTPMKKLDPGLASASSLIEAMSGAPGQEQQQQQVATPEQARDPPWGATRHTSGIHLQQRRPQESMYVPSTEAALRTPFMQQSRGTSSQGTQDQGWHLSRTDSGPASPAERPTVPSTSQLVQMLAQAQQARAAAEGFSELPSSASSSP
eukprot:scaffold60708_cov19-Tisochrysis_lutea.AAC.1